MEPTPLDHPEKLSVTFQGRTIGHIVVTEQTTQKLIGRFVPDDALDQNRTPFDEARAWAKRFDESHDSDALDYFAFDQYVAALNRLTPMIGFPELSGVEEFAIDQHFCVEITFGETDA